MRTHKRIKRTVTAEFTDDTEIIGISLPRLLLDRQPARQQAK